MIFASCVGGFVIRFGILGSDGDSVRFNAFASLALALLWIAIMALKRTADPLVLGIGIAEYRRVFSAVAVLLAAVALIQLVSGTQLSRGMLLIAMPLGLIGCLLVHHFAGRSLRRKWREGIGVARTLIVAGDDRRAAIESSLHDTDALGMSVVGWLHGRTLAVRSDDANWLPIRGDSGLLDAVDSLRADIVVLADTSCMKSQEFRDLTWALHERGATLAVEPAVGDVALSRMAMSQLNGTSVLQIDDPTYNRAMNLGKRLFDIVLSAAALVALAPVILGVALLIKVGDGGSIFYGANRVGVGGRPIKMWKFRSMVLDAEAKLAAVRAAKGLPDDAFFKAEDDPRITRVGRVIRKTSIDELPQLFNVLKGEMSIVGPRPMVLGEGSQYANFVERRVLVRPGITGLWQVSGRSDITDDERVRLDLMYVENWSMAGDLAIIAKTFGSVVKMEGAY